MQQRRPKAPYRIYHRSFEEYLLPNDDDEQERPHRVYPKEAHAEIARQLIGRDDGGAESWDACDQYGQRYLALHLAGAGMWEELRDLLDDPLYLITAEPTQLLAALDAGRSELPRRSANLYRGIVHRLRDQPIEVAAAYLDLAACQSGTDTLRKHEAYDALARPWRVRWSRWERENPSRVLTRHTGNYVRLALATFEDRKVVVSIARDLQVTFLDDGLPAREPIESPRDWGGAGVAVTRLEGQLTFLTAGTEGIKRWGMDSDKGELLASCDVTVNRIVLWEASDSVFLIGGCKDGTVRMWDLNLGTPPFVVGAHGEYKYQLGSKDGPVMGGKDVLCVTVGELGGEPVLATGGQDKTIRLWKLPELAAIGEPLTGHTSWIEALRFVKMDSRTLLLSGGAIEDSPRIWDPAEGIEVGTNSPVPEGFYGNSAIYDLEVGEVDGRPCAITCSYDGGIRLWDLPHGEPIGDPLIGHDGPVRSLAIDRSSSRHALVSGGQDKTVRHWDLEDCALAAHGGERHSSTAVSIAVGHYEGRSVVCCADMDWVLRMLDVATGEPVGESVGNPVQIHPNAVVGFTHVPFAFGIVEGRPAVAAYFDERLGFFEPATAEEFGVPRPMKPTDGYINEIRFSRLAEGAVVVASSTEGDIWVESARGERIAGLVAPNFSAVTAATLDGHDYAASGGYGSGNPVTLQKLADGSVAATFGTGHSGHVSAIAGGTLTGTSVVATGGSEGDVRLWTTCGELLNKISFGSHIGGLAFSGEADLVVSTKKGIVVLRMADLRPGSFSGPTSPDGTSD